jgi:1-acyl-sn-glycerol-3-phosphate acyltransferase
VIKKLASFIFHLLGWKSVGEIPSDIKKYIIVAAPHTSNWDFVYGMLFFLMKGTPFKYFIKKEWYFFPFSVLFKALGGIPVDRSKKENLTDQMVAVFSQYEELVILISPEGTRSYNPNWKKGFYYISQKTKAPIILGYIDYENKIGGFGPVFKTTGDVDKDIGTMKNFFKDKKGKYPEKGVR